MGIDPTKYGMKDYAAEFKTKTDLQAAYNRGRMEAAGITVPIGQTQTKGTASDEIPEDAVRSDLGLTISTAQPADGTRQALTTDKVEETDQTSDAQTKPAEGEEQPQQDYARKLTTKEAREAKQKEYEQMFAECGDSFEDEAGNVHYLNKDAYKKAEKERKANVKAAEKRYKEQGYTKQEAKERANKDYPKNYEYRSAEDRAKRLVKNDRNRENMQVTRQYIDKSAYDEAERQRKARRDELVKQYVNDGKDKKEAEQLADAQLPMNTYIKDKKTRQFVQDNPEMFYDDDGNFSSDKTRDTVSGFCNEGRADGAVEDAYLSLKEQRQIAAEHDTSAKVIRKLGEGQNAGVEKDYTNTIRWTVAGATAAAITATAIVGVTSEAAAGAAASSSATATGAASAATGAGGAYATANATGAVIAAEAAGGAGLGALLKDKGGKIEQNYLPKQKVEEQQDDNVQDDEQDDNQDDTTIETPCQLTPDEFHYVVQEEVPQCKYPVRPGDNWSKVVLAKYRVKTGEDANGIPITRALTSDEAKKVWRELKMVHGIDKKNFKDCTFFTPYYKVVTLPNGKKHRMYIDELIEKGLLTEEDMQSDAYKASLMTLPEVFDGLYSPELKDLEFVVNCDAKTDGKISSGPAIGKVGIVGTERNVAVRDYNIDQYWYTDCNNNRSNIFATAGERDVDMARRQAELNAQAGK